jgi:hypothetical protein
MNIFAIYDDPHIAARHLVDSHVSKMVLESAQMLANCFSLEQLASTDCPRTKEGSPRKYSYYKHPCSIWTRASRDNMRWLIDHAKTMDDERIQRALIKQQRHKDLKEKGLLYSKKIFEEDPSPHFSLSFILWAEANIANSIIPEGARTKFAQAMPDEFKCEDSIEAYRKFYITGKKHLHFWTRNKPDWIT